MSLNTGGVKVLQIVLEFIGENVCDETVWVQKSHDPVVMPEALIHKVNKVICCVRNPYDIMISMTHFIGGVMSGELN